MHSSCTYIYDHRLVGIELNTKKHLDQIDNQPRRPFNKFKLEEFKEEFNIEEIPRHSNLESHMDCI